MPPLYLIRAPLTPALYHWAERFAPHHRREFGSQKRMISYQIGRAVLEAALSHFYTIPPPLSLTQSAHGKPHLTLPNAPHFNLSHSEHTLLLALSQIGPIGIDIETIAPRRQMVKLLERKFTETEAAWIEAQTDPTRAFFWLWSAKEAYLKADGRGLVALSQLHLNPARKSMNGPLNRGELRIGDHKGESMALYLPNPQTKIEAYRLNDDGLFQSDPDALSWQLHLESVEMA